MGQNDGTSDGPTLPLPSLEKCGDLLPFLNRERFGLFSLELPAEHPVRPREPHRRQLGEVAQALLHAVDAFRIAIKEHRYDPIAEFTGERCYLHGLLAGDGVGTERHRGHPKRIKADHVVGALDEQETESFA